VYRKNCEKLCVEIGCVVIRVWKERGVQRRVEGDVSGKWDRK